MLLGALPLQEDMDEAEAVYGSLCGLLLHPDTSPRVAPVLPQILQVSVPGPPMPTRFDIILLWSGCLS